MLVPRVASCRYGRDRVWGKARESSSLVVDMFGYEMVWGVGWEVVVEADKDGGGRFGR